MAIVNTPYTHSLKILTGSGDWLIDTVKLAILSSGYTFSAAHTQFDNGANDATDPSYSELASGDGYTTGGVSLAGKTVANNNINAESVTFPFTASKTFRQGVLYIDATVDSIPKPVLFHIIFDSTPADITVPGIDFVINWNASGIATLAVA